MHELVTADLLAILPALWLAVAGMALLMAGVFLKDGASRIVFWGAVTALAVAGFLVILGPRDALPFDGLLVVDAFGRFMTVLVVAGAGLTLIMAQGFMRRESMDRFELPVLLVFATLGMFLMVQANDLMSLYVGLEMQSLALYVCAAFQQDKIRSTEAGLKYFVLGAVASGMLLYGCSMVYGFSASTSFHAIARSLAADSGSTGMLMGVVFIAAGLAFKISAVPFHMWTPDVYEGAPTPITAFFSIAPKVAAMALLLRVLTGPFADLFGHWQQIVFLLAVASMVLGALGAIGQRNIKRLMAYSSIGHVGFALVGLAAGSQEGIHGIAVYLAIYLVMGLGTWGCILAMRRDGAMVEGIDDLSGLSRTHPAMALCLAVFMFSMAGIPPLAGFFGKFYVFMAAVDAGLYTLTVIGVLTSVIGAFYYIRIVKLMYFDDPAEAFDRPMGRDLAPVVFVATVFTVGFFLHSDPLLDSARDAAVALIGNGGDLQHVLLAQ